MHPIDRLRGVLSDLPWMKIQCTSLVPLVGGCIMFKERERDAILLQNIYQGETSRSTADDANPGEGIHV